MTPFYQDSDESVTLYHGDIRDVIGHLPSADLVILDPPYGDTSLPWDRRNTIPLEWFGEMLKPHGSLWVFGSLRFFLSVADQIDAFKVVQELVWHKHNGSSFRADRFRRVHELILHLYVKGVKWADVYKSPVYTMDATKRTLRRKTRPPHMGGIGDGPYQSEDGGPRLMRSVIEARSTHGYAVHPTQKPVDIIAPLLRYSCPPGGIVVDPMAGSCTTLVVAKMLGMRAIGVERDEKYCEVAAKRLSQQTLPWEATA